MSNKFAYDIVPYPSLTFPQTNPDRLATMGSYFGMSPASPEKCRVLELACGDGTNLMSFAYMFPKSSFVGLDLSEVHISEANQTATTLDLRNATFLQEDLLDVDTDALGEFDFIIAHGIYSWVPEQVRQRMLQIYSKCLSPNGVGYISYNAFPGCHVRQMVGEMLRYHVEGIADPGEKLGAAHEFLEFLRDAAEPDSNFQKLIEDEAASIAERDPSNVFHDDLAEVNQPFYFHEFVKQLSSEGLQFLSEAEPWGVSIWNPNSDVASRLEGLAPDQMRREQYMDFVTCRRFRCSLVCRDNIQLDREPGADTVKQFFLASPVRAASEKPNLCDPTVERFISPKGITIQINHPLTKAVLVYLQKMWTRSVDFEKVITKAREMLASQKGADGNDAEVDRTAAFLVDLFKAGFVRFQSFQPKFAVVAGEFPKASSFAVWQVRRGCPIITTLSGMDVEMPDDHVKQLILLLDGTRDRAAIAEDIRLSVTATNGDKAEFEKNLPQAIETNLAKLAEVGLLEE